MLAASRGAPTRGGSPRYASSFTGLGDCDHLAGPSITLTALVADIVQVLDVEGAILVLHSSAGVPDAMAADQAHRSSLAKLIVLDALQPEDSRPFSAFSPPVVWAARTAAARASPAHGIAAAVPGFIGVTVSTDAAWLARHFRPQPLGTYKEAARLTQPIGQGLDMTYASGEAPLLAALTPSREQARGAKGWRIEPFAAPHGAMVTHPRATSDTLLKLVLGWFHSARE